MWAACGLAAVSVPSAFAPAWTTLVWVLDVAFLALVAVDWRRTPDPAGLEVERRLPPTVGLGGDLTREVSIAGARAGAAVELFEEYPEHAVLARHTIGGRSVDADPAHEGERADTGRADELGRCRLARTYTLTRRGRFALGDLRIRLHSPLGLVTRQVRLAGSSEFSVEPALLNLRRHLALAASERWQDLGVRRVRRYGGRTEFESLRDYVVGDDLRTVDWKATAKRGKTTVRQYQEERGQELILMIDCGRRMRATAAHGRAAGWSKLDWALDAGLQLAAIALQRGDRVGALAFDSDVRAWVAPARGALQLARLRESLFALLPTSTEPDFARALRVLAARHRRRALVLILSDVADNWTVEHQRRAFASAARRHRLIFAALDDPSLRAAAAGELDRSDLEVSPAALRAASMELVEDRRRALADLRAGGIRVLNPVPAEAAGPLIAAWLEARRGAG